MSAPLELGDQLVLHLRSRAKMEQHKTVEGLLPESQVKLSYVCHIYLVEYLGLEGLQKCLGAFELGDKLVLYLQGPLQLPLEALGLRVLLGFWL